MAIWCNTEGGLDDFPSFNYHPLLVVLGLVVLGGESILCYRLLREPKRKTLKYIHLILMIAVFIMMVLGIYCVYSVMSSHFTGPHQWMGLVTAILFSLQLVHGFVWRLWPGAPSSLVSWYHSAHAFFGITTFLCACATAMMGMAIDASSDTTLGSFIENLFPLVVAAFAVSVVYFVINPKYRRKDFPNFGGSEEEKRHILPGTKFGE